jgi:hypothetical protein
VLRIRKLVNLLVDVEEWGQVTLVNMLTRYARTQFQVINRFLKVPKSEIFDRSDFNDFYTIKSLREGDFGVKMKKI